MVTMRQAESAARQLAEDEKRLKELQARISQNRKKAREGRNKARTNVGMETYGKVVSKLGLFEKEQACQLKKDFVALQAEILTKIEHLVEIEKDVKDGKPVDAIKTKIVDWEAEAEKEEGAKNATSPKSEEK